MPKPVKKALAKKSLRRAATLDDGTLPKPVLKAVKKAKRPSSDPMTRMGQMHSEHMRKVEQSTPPWADDTSTVDTRGRFTPDPPGVSVLEPTFAEQLSAHMRALGAKGGKVSGAKRMEMPEAKRKAIAKKGAAARWAKKAKP